ncbi:SAM-dependent methyltransferase [Dactylosporangium aurantiacum]|uniref:SAM-dependent methyltransferase n=1 Tax=Dactylosporangium aurantiacum TaxID=35754 RepID=A0A9Q9ITP6_9ACTN|nr:SAM-dependent methyltransferase [Dactylosporangium aurantiacum]MDG6107618.1 SAM-dependent methyltransferase [Dactylosporangium aurantiacum]UWZ58783.1 SAM-dependent methyltransferase [Dactylosporangium aurantiacum]
MTASQAGVPEVPVDLDRLGVDTTRPHPARRYDYLLGGKDNFAADRASADELALTFPHIRTAARENRRFLIRAVRWLARAGVRQFLDVGTGYPTAPNVHEAAHAINPDSRVLYVDNDPVVVAHARALLTSPQPDAIGYLQADLRNPATILNSAQAHATLDFHQPIGLLLVAVLHFLDDTDHPYQVVNTLIERLPPGSYLALSHVTFDPLPDDTTRNLTALARPTARHGTFRARTRDEIAQFVSGLDLIDPGLVSVVDWHPDENPKPEAPAEQAAFDAAVARLP